MLEGEPTKGCDEITADNTFAMTETINGNSVAYHNAETFLVFNDMLLTFGTIDYSTPKFNSRSPQPDSSGIVHTYDLIIKIESTQEDVPAPASRREL
jgi:hypothetical protein